MDRFKIEICSSFSFVTPRPDSHTIKLIDQVTSYEAPREYIRGMGWKQQQSRIRLFDRRKYCFPSGLVNRVAKHLKRNGVDVEIIDRRTQPLDGHREAFRRLMDLPFKLRPYQLNTVVQALNKPFGTFSLPTGVGKSVILAAIIAAYDKQALLMTHRKELLFQLQRTLQQFTGVDDIGVIGDGHWNPKRWTVGLVDTLSRFTQKKTEFLSGIEHVVVDECFVAGTRVNTPDGYKVIDNIYADDEVWSYDTKLDRLVIKKVVRVFKSKVHELVSLTTKGGRRIICTPNHKFWACDDNSIETIDKWKHATQLSLEHMILCLLNLDDTPRRAWDEVCSISEIEHDRLDPDKPGGLQDVCPDGYVYNLEVEDTHTYLVEDLVVSNCHHEGARTWHQVTSKAFNTVARHGFSGTVFRNDNADIKIFGHLGEIAVKYTTSQMIEDGWLSRPTIYMKKIKCLDMVSPSAQWQTVQKVHIIENRLRNEFACQFIIEQAKQNKQVLVLVSIVRHGNIILEMLTKEMDVDPAFVRYMHGSEHTGNRKAALADFKAKRFPILIGTNIYNEGVDLPLINAAANLAGGASDGPSTQRLGRVLRKTVKPGWSDVDTTEEQTVEYLDFMDVGHPFVRKHSNQRLALYKSESAFRVEEI